MRACLYTGGCVCVNVSAYAQRMCNAYVRVCVRVIHVCTSVSTCVCMCSVCVCAAYV